jgi:Phosphotransferase enzyme family
MRWLAGCSAEALHAALEVVAPELGTCDVLVPEPTGEDPQYHKSSVVVGGRFVVKFAWSRPAALRLAREIGLLTALATEPAVPFLPEVVVSSTDPLLLVTRRVPGASLFDVVESLDLDRTAGQLASFLAALHLPASRERAEAAIGPLAGIEIPLAQPSRNTTCVPFPVPEWAQACGC